jgi:uncharacterized protein (TIGR02594 family)
MSAKPSPSAAIYAAAAKHLGTAELKGKASNPKIRAWIKQAASWLDGDDSATAWCGCFRGAIGLETGTGVPRAHYRAASWATWGRPVDITKPDTWQRGDTIVMTRPGGNHVCLFDRIAGNVVYCLGGNQGDAVTIAPFPRSRITHVRR